MADVTILTERQRKMLRFALWLFKNDAHAQANAAAQDKNGRFFDYILMATRLAWQAWHAGWVERMPELGTNEPEVGTSGVALPAEAQRLVDECAPFLKDGETPAECIERNRKDAQTAISAYYNDAHRYRALRAIWLDSTGKVAASQAMCRANTEAEFDKALDEQRAAASARGVAVAPAWGPGRPDWKATHGCTHECRQGSECRCDKEATAGVRGLDGAEPSRGGA